MEKKISFGFSKISKKTNILPNKLVLKDEPIKKELIKGLEGQSIQLVKEKVEEAPLVIPLKDNRKTSAALLSLKTRQAVLNGEEVPIQKEPDVPTKKSETSEEQNDADTIEKRAAQELLAEVSKSQNVESVDSSLVLPVKSDELPLDGAKESTIDDYDSIPISQFGRAMLRGMGWKDEPKKADSAIDDGIVVRPKGMGLGADKALKPKALLVPPEANEVLEIKKGACIRVLGGKHKDLYGQIEGLDDHAGRVIVKMALGGTKESFNEFMVQVVSKKEYAQYSKCINSAKYDEYKRKENAHGQIIIKKEESHKKENLENDRDRIHKDSHHDRNYDRTRTSPHRNGSERDNRSEKPIRRSRSRERRGDYTSSSTSNRKYADRRSPSRDHHRSEDSDSSDSSSHRSKHKKSSKKKKSKKSKDKSHDRRPISVSSSDEDRRYKKKTKKSKRGRSRSKCRR